MRNLDRGVDASDVHVARRKLLATALVGNQLPGLKRSESEEMEAEQLQCTPICAQCTLQTWLRHQRRTFLESARLL